MCRLNALPATCVLCAVRSRGAGQLAPRAPRARMPYAYHSLGCAVRTEYCTTSRTTSGRSAPPSPTTRSASNVATRIASTISSSARASVTSSTRSLWRIDGGTPRCHRCHRRLRLHRRRQRLPATRRTPNSSTTAQLGTRSLRAAEARVARRYFSRRAQTALRSACARTRSAPAAPTARGTTPPVPPTNASSSAPLTPPHRAVSPVRTPSASTHSKAARAAAGVMRRMPTSTPTHLFGLTSAWLAGKSVERRNCSILIRPALLIAPAGTYLGVVPTARGSTLTAASISA